MSWNQLFGRKNLDHLLEETKSDQRLKRALGPINLTALGIGAIIGAGIFAGTGEAAGERAGPALMVSYIVCGVTCIFAALCYAEFASMAPVAGSAYTYAYITMGELFAWIIGWDLVLEYAVGAATVANSWSSYLQKVLHKVDIVIPDTFRQAAVVFDKDQVLEPTFLSQLFGHYVVTGAWFNLPAVLVVAVMTMILVKGISESAGFNALMVFIKVGAVVFVILVGSFYVNPQNWVPFAPYGWGGFSLFGYHPFGGEGTSGKPVGMLAGAAIAFFAYIGFDSVSTHAEEAKNPKRDIPIAIIGSLLICTVLYVGVVAVLTGMVSYKQIDKDAGVSSAFAYVGLHWAEAIIASAGVAGMTSVLLVMMLSAPRVFLAMARDGLVPKSFFADVHPRFRTPWKSTIAIGCFVATLAGFLPIDALLDLTNIGTLFAFVVVCAAVLIMRRTSPDVERPFRCPLVPLVPIAGIALCLMLMCSLAAANWYRLFGWMGLGLVIYFTYGIHHSVLRTHAVPDIAADAVNDSNPHQG